ncbi:zinc finger protein 8 [Vigna unguiculata]|uniref:C2H2-type domain-containing protein n=1 Tax=Vigna unguiculata TaxID=3917 RepID=A0A4D6MVA3_VIGUN|nr:zinc finger protein 8 [Vigna unguiculata]QCE05343.1 hypothetical protein DEO72_LG9g346 [Vigna unguiculata]
MDKTTSTTTTSDREVHDFMNVDSFSQLPFIRPAPLVKEKSAIRLFGIEFAGGGNNTAVSPDQSDSAETITNTTNNNNLNSFELDATKDDTTTTTVTTVTDNNGESSRRFECHYCCRNFPTSQALGGHQNAHKRERQHAKRAHLQSTMVHGSTFSDAHHVYNLMNYRFGSAPTPPMPYPTWNNAVAATATATNNTRFYGTTPFSHSHHQHHQQPINGNPLALWRIPSNNPSFSHERSSLPPLFASEEITNVRASQVVGSSGSQNRYVYDAKRGSVHDHVSLDLHL